MSPPRVTWLTATDGSPTMQPIWTLLTGYLARIAAGRARTRLDHCGLSAGGVRHPATRLTQDAVYLAAAERVRADTDALVFGCWGSPTAEARALLDVPVTSPMEAAVRLAPLFATRAAVVTVAPGLVDTFTRDIHALGTHGLLDPPVHAVDPETTYLDVCDAITDPAPLITRFDAVAARAADRGADAILVGCGFYAAVFDLHGYRHVLRRPDVPVVDCNALAFELALSQYALRERVAPSRASFAPPAGASRDLLGAVLGRLGPARTDGLPLAQGTPAATGGVGVTG